MSQPIASIVHLSDLHLYADPELTDPDDNVRAEARKRFKKKVWFTKRLGAIFGLDKLDVCNNVALAALEDALVEHGNNPAAGADHGPATVVIHTGDVETLGPRVETNGTAHFDGFDYLHSHVRDGVMGGVAWIDVYGNHDVWGGAWPVFERLAGKDEHSPNFDRIREVDGFDSYTSSLPVASACRQATVDVRARQQHRPRFRRRHLRLGQGGLSPCRRGHRRGVREASGRLGAGNSATDRCGGGDAPPAARLRRRVVGQALVRKEVRTSTLGGFS